jgi:hypothetical protein
MSINDSSSGFDNRERRQMPRLYYPFPAKVSGVDERGRAFEVDTTVDNMCANGLYLTLAWKIKVGAKISVIVRFAATPVNTERAAQVKIDGVVLRLEEKYSGTCGVGVRFERHRFL